MSYSICKTRFKRFFKKRKTNKEKALSTNRKKYMEEPSSRRRMVFWRTESRAVGPGHKVPVSATEEQEGRQMCPRERLLIGPAVRVVGLLCGKL